MFFVGLVALSICAPNAKGQAEPRDCESKLMVAIHKHDAPEAIRLIKSGENKAAVTCASANPLLLEALSTQQPDIAIALINSGEDVNKSDTDGTTPLISASFYCQAEVVPLLLAKGARIEAADMLGNTALLVASLGHCPDNHLVQTLIKNGANIKHISTSGQTPLLLAARYGDEVAVRVLVEKGADPCAKDNDGRTALSNAQNKEVKRTAAFDHIVDFLLKNSHCE